MIIWEGGLEILPYEHFSLVTGMEAGWILASRMALFHIACNISTSQASHLNVVIQL